MDLQAVKALLLQGSENNAQLSDWWGLLLNALVCCCSFPACYNPLCTLWKRTAAGSFLAQAWLEPAGEDTVALNSLPSASAFCFDCINTENYLWLWTSLYLNPEIPSLCLSKHFVVLKDSVSRDENSPDITSPWTLQSDGLQWRDGDPRALEKVSVWGGGS